MFIILFSQELQAQHKAYKKFKDSLFYGPRVTSLNDVLSNLNRLIKSTSDIKKTHLYRLNHYGLEVHRFVNLTKVRCTESILLTQG